MRSAPSDYLTRINRAIDLIVRDLAQPLSLRAMSETSGSSPFHFHRVFKALVGETPNQFVKRLRLERSLYLMSHAPRRIDLHALRDTRRADFDRLLGTQYAPPQLKVLDVGANPDGFEVRLRDLPARNVAYVRVFDPYREGAAQAAFERLLAWAQQRGLADGQWLGYMWDEPEIVALKDCRYDAALVVDEFVPEGDIGCYRFPAMRAAKVDIRGDIHAEVRALDWLYKTWLPHSGYTLGDHPAFEAWIGRPFAHGNEHFELSCQLPIRHA